MQAKNNIWKFRINGPLEVGYNQLAVESPPKGTVMTKVCPWRGVIMNQTLWVHDKEPQSHTIPNGEGWWL